MQCHQGDHTGVMRRKIIGVSDKRHPLQELGQYAGLRDILVAGVFGVIELGFERFGIGPVNTEFVCNAD